MTDYEETIKRLRADYDWRGPSGKAQRHLVVPRHLVKALLDVLDPPLSDTLLASMDSAEIRERMRASDEVSPIVKRALERFWKRLDEEKSDTRTDTPAGLIEAEPLKTDGRGVV
jgi:hypothetical protein